MRSFLSRDDGGTPAEVVLLLAAVSLGFAVAFPVHSSAFADSVGVAIRDLLAR